MRRLFPLARNEGEALKWNSSLPLDALRSFDDVIDGFTGQ